MSCQGGPDGHPNGGDQCSKSLDKVDSPHYVLGVSCGDRPRMGKLTAFMKSHVAEPNTKTKLKISRGHKAVAKRKTARFFLCTEPNLEVSTVRANRRLHKCLQPMLSKLQDNSDLIIMTGNTKQPTEPHHIHREHTMELNSKF